MKVDALLVVDRQFLPTMSSVLDHAQKSVRMVAYSFAWPRRGGGPKVVADKLVELARRGVDVHVFMEGKRETAVRNRGTAAVLEDGGVRVTWGSTHAKGVCVDERYVLFGSTNLTEQSIAKNSETNLFFDDARVAAGFLAYFEHLRSGGDVVLPAPMLADGAFEPALIEMCDRAQKTIDFSIYFFDRKPIEEALVRAAERGVRVRGMVHDHETFAMSYVRRTRRTVSRLRGVEVVFGPKHLFTHSKYLVRDGEEILLGTGNWLDEDVYVHPQLYVRFTNKQVGGQLVARLAGKMGA